MPVIHLVYVQGGVSSWATIVAGRGEPLRGAGQALYGRSSKMAVTVRASSSAQGVSVS
jgi:hypothetical protein